MKLTDYSARKWVLATAAVLLAAVMSSGCGSTKDKAGISSGTPSSDDKEAIKKVTFAYAGSTCESPIFVAYEKGFFKEEGLDVTLIQQDFETLKTGIATGKVDGTIGNFSWFKPIEQGFDVKLTGGLHSGCIQLVVPSGSAIRSIKELKGKTIGVERIGGGPHITLSITLKQNGIDPDKDVEWRAYPSQQLSTATDKGEIDAFIVWDPAAQQAIDDKNYTRLLSNGHDEPFKSGYCCYAVINGELTRQDPDKAAAITRALFKASEWVGQHPNEAAEIQVGKKYVSSDVETNAKLLSNYFWNPAVQASADNVKFFVKYQKELGILEASTDEAELFDRLFFEAVPDYKGK